MGFDFPGFYSKRFERCGACGQRGVRWESRQTFPRPAPRFAAGELSTNPQRCSLSGRPRGGLLWPEVGFIGRLPAQRLMRPAPVVPVEEGREAPLLREAVGARAQIDPLVLDRPPQPLDEDVVVAAPAPVHADADAVALEHPGERFRGELAALVGIKDLRSEEHTSE